MTVVTCWLGCQATNGGFFLVGFSEYREKRTNAALLVKADPEGQLEWYRDVLLTSTGQSLGYTVRPTPDGGCVFTGHTTSKSAGSLDLLLVRVDVVPPDTLFDDIRSE
jgi:hypothetical protein